MKGHIKGVTKQQVDAVRKSQNRSSQDRSENNKSEQK